MLKIIIQEGRFTLRWQGFEYFFLTFLVEVLCGEKESLSVVLQVTLDLAASDKTCSPAPATPPNSGSFYVGPSSATHYWYLIVDVAAPIAGIIFMFQ